LEKNKEIIKKFFFFGTSYFKNENKDKLCFTIINSFKKNVKKNFMKKIMKSISSKYKAQKERKNRKNKRKFYLKFKCFCNLSEFLKYVKQSSLGLLHYKSRIRLIIIKIIKSKFFEYFIGFIIFLNTIILILDNPWNDPNGYLFKLLKSLNIVFTIIFVIEAILKILGLGLFYNFEGSIIEKNKIFAGKILNKSINDKSNKNRDKDNDKDIDKDINIQKPKYINENQNQKQLIDYIKKDKKNKSNIFGLNKKKNDNDNNKKNQEENKNDKNNNNENENQNENENDINLNLNLQDNQNQNKNKENLINENNPESEFKIKNESNQNINKDKIDLKKAYLSLYSNWIDLFVVIFGLMDLIYSNDFIPASSLKVLRLFRSLRPIKILTNNKNLKLIIHTILKSIPLIRNTFIICGVFIYIYAIIGINLFKNNLTYLCSSKKFITKDDCILNEGIWFYNIYNFDNIFNALFTLFNVIMIQNWQDLLNSAYIKTQSIICYFYFFSIIIFGNLFVLNLIITVVIEKYKSLKEKNSKLFFLSEEEREWIKVQKIMLKFNPLPKIQFDESSNLRKKIYKFITH
jgi:hypothetical protein